MVFEDVESGELVSRTHSGRTFRSYEPPTTANNISGRGQGRNVSPERMVSRDAESALTAIRDGRVLSAGEWESDLDNALRKGKSKLL